MQKPTKPQPTRQLSKSEQQLFQAAKDGNFTVFQEIVEQGVNPSTLDENGFSVFDYLILGNISEHDRGDIRSMLENNAEELRSLRKDPIRLTELKQQLFQAAKNQQVDKFLELVSQGLDPFMLDEHGIAAISYLSPSKVNSSDRQKILDLLYHNTAKPKE
ncbi:MAG: hypothetical protein DGJ47_000556 [Rickettsiaceae bacterium]